MHNRAWHKKRIPAQQLFFGDCRAGILNYTRLRVPITKL